MHAITFARLNILIFNKNFQTSYYLPNQMVGNCFTQLNKFFTFLPHNLCILFAINFFYFFFLLMKMKDNGKIKFFWKLEDYNYFIRIYSIVLIQVYADRNFEFYRSLNLIKF